MLPWTPEKPQLASVTALGPHAHVIQAVCLFPFKVRPPSHHFHDPYGYSYEPHIALCISCAFHLWGRLSQSHASPKFYVAKDDLKLITPPLPPICWDYRYGPPCLYLGTWPSLSLFNASLIL